MKKASVSAVVVNLFGVFLLVTLIVTPLYFAKNFTKIAGVKSPSQFLIISQVEKFPGMTFSQQGDQYQISFTKVGNSQAYLGVLILNNPTSGSKTYQIERASGETKVFFGEDLENQQAKTTLPSGSSISVSLLSDEVSENSVDFAIK